MHVSLLLPQIKNFHCTVTKSCPTLCNHMECSTPASLSFTISQSLLKLMSVETVMLSKHLILCCTFSSCLHSFPASVYFPMRQLFASSGQSNYWSFSFSISPPNEHSVLASFRIDWFDLLAVQGTLKSFLQHYSLKASILQSSSFFMVQLSHLYITTGKATALIVQTFVSKVMSLILNILSRIVRAFLPRSKCLLISWLQ